MYYGSWAVGKRNTIVRLIRNALPAGIANADSAGRFSKWHTINIQLQENPERSKAVLYARLYFYLTDEFFHFRAVVTVI